MYVALPAMRGGNIFRNSWDVVVAVTGGHPELGYLDGVFMAGRGREKQARRVRHHGHEPETVRAILREIDGLEASADQVELLGYRGGQIPTYYAKLEDLELVDLPEDESA